MQLENLLNQHLGEVRDIAEVHVLELHSYRSHYEYETTDSQQIEILLQYLDKISLRRVIFPPQSFQGGTDATYQITFVDKEQDILVISLFKDYVVVHFNKTFRILEPQNFEGLSEIIAEFPHSTQLFN